MHILIADDEELTRNGIISSIDWKALGISKIDSADDGFHALECVKGTPVDILLTDVRMPRMDGIELSRRLRQQNPDCPIIFMSGYSDKEYLKAAINLKAVSYVEKPFVTSEIFEALSEAVALVKKLRLQRESNQFFLQETSSKLALALTQPGACDKLESAAKELLDNFAPDQYFTTLIIRTDRLFSVTDNDLHAFFAQIRQRLSSHGMDELHTMKHASHVIIHLHSSKKPEPKMLLDICHQIRNMLLAGGITQFHMILGDPVKGCQNAYRSYNNAVLLLQSAFFAPCGSICTPFENGSVVSMSWLHQFPDRFDQVLSDKDQDAACGICDELRQTLYGNRNLLPNQARDLYYKLFMVLSQQQYESKISALTDSLAKSPLERINNCASFDELHLLLSNAVKQYFEALHAAVPDSSTLFLIKDYISSNYSDSSLSIKDISEHVHLSSSYLCTVFKTETGQTLNQYLTQFRIEKAKQLLLDPRNKISEIAALVGYCDSNYFGKAFKKVVGLSPSEYREKEFLC